MRRFIQKSFNNLCGKRFISKHTNGFKVSVVGGASEVGQSLSTMLKSNNLISHLALFDDVPLIHTIAMDLSQVSSKSKVTGHNGRAALIKNSQNSNIIIITNGFSKKLILNRKDIINDNAQLLKDILPDMINASPKALIAIALHPINVMIPIAAIVLQQKKLYDPKRLFGITSLKELRAKIFLAQELKIDPQRVKINIIGGNSGCTAIPVISGAAPKFNKSERIIREITKKIQTIGEPSHCSNVSHQLTPIAIASSISNFVDSLLKALNCEPDIYECCFVESYVSNCNFFATEVELSSLGIGKIRGIPKLTYFEEKLLKQAVPILNEDVKLGLKIGSNTI